MLPACLHPDEDRGQWGQSCGSCAALFWLGRLAQLVKLLLVALTILIIAAATLVACATPRERTQPPPQPEPSVERRSPAGTGDQQQSELAGLVRDASAVTAADSFRMSGSGDAKAVHELAAGLYQCGIDLRDNLQAERPAPFRIHFVSRQPLDPGVIGTTQSDWTTSFELLLAGSAQTSSSQVEIRLNAAQASKWTLQCDRHAEFDRSGRGSRSVIQLNMNPSDEPRGNVGYSSGRGSGMAMISAIPDVYVCQISVSGNFADDVGEAQFVVKLGELTLVEVATSTWSGEVEYELRRAGAGDVRPTLTVTAGDSASWDIVCSPKAS